MWPLGFLLLFATAAPQQASPDTARIHLQLQQHKLSIMQKLRSGNMTSEELQQYLQSNTCYTMRSYFFRRQDGQAPVPAGMTTCTPASILQQRRVSPAPGVRFVPLGAQQDEQK
jgi:hypothetical protein